VKTVHYNISVSPPLAMNIGPVFTHNTTHMAGGGLKRQEVAQLVRQTISCETINILHKHSFEYCDLSVGCNSSGAKGREKGARSNHLCRI